MNNGVAMKHHYDVVLITCLHIDIDDVTAGKISIILLLTFVQ